jgi:hypothetical protein
MVSRDIRRSGGGRELAATGSVQDRPDDHLDVAVVESGDGVAEDDGCLADQAGGEEQPYILAPCHCGCGQDTDRDFLPGHDVRAMQACVRQHFAGSPLKFLQWVDSQLTSPAPSGQKDS